MVPQQISYQFISVSDDFPKSHIREGFGLSRKNKDASVKAKQPRCPWLHKSRNNTGGTRMNKIKKILSVVMVSLMIVSSVSGCRTDPENGRNDREAGFGIAENAKVSYLGPAGTYTEEAAQFFFRDQDGAVLIPEATVPEAIEAVVSGNADYAVIPQENTLGGAVTNYVDALLSADGIYVVGEVILPISQTLMGIPGASLDDIRTVCSHTQGIVQSETWRGEHLPDAVVQEMPSTAAAASYVAETGDRTIAAIAAPGAAQMYGLSVLAENVQITDANKTRFYVLAASAPEGGPRTHAVFAASCGADRIDDIIVEIHNAGMELVRIHDRPEGSRLGAYRYIIEVENEKGISDKLLRKIEGIPEVRFLGSFHAVEKQT